MLELIVKGGPVMAPILLGSVLGVAIFFERLWALRRGRTIPDPFFHRVEKLIGEGRREHALAACEENQSALAQVLAPAIRSAGASREYQREAVELAGRAEVALLERFVGLLGTIAAVEPLLGLLGTVTGLIEAFRRIEAEGILGDPSIVAGGVWEALITTAAGLIVAIPAYLGYRYLRARVKGLVLEMEQRCFMMIELLSSRPAAPASLPAANGLEPAPHAASGG